VLITAQANLALCEIRKMQRFDKVDLKGPADLLKVEELLDEAVDRHCMQEGASSELRELLQAVSVSAGHRHLHKPSGNYFYFSTSARAQQTSLTLQML
jgi:hypothetical protein